jgi:hypothetical protein
MTTLKNNEQNINPSNTWCHDIKPIKFLLPKTINAKKKYK